jgi:UDPglucose 6-dehydrogenase
MGAKVRAYDPAGMQQARNHLNDISYCEDAYECARDADALVIITEWEEFRALDLDRVESIMAQPIIIDLRNVYRVDDMQKRNFRYFSVGRPSVEGDLVASATRREPMRATS